MDFAIRDIIVMAIVGALALIIIGGILGEHYLYHVIKTDHIPVALKGCVVYKKKNGKPLSETKSAKRKEAERETVDIVDIMEEL